jgi:hypothetical protein
MVDEPDPLTEMLSWSDDDWMSLRETLGVDLSADQIRTILRFAESCGGLEEALDALEQVTGDKRAA